MQSQDNSINPVAEQPTVKRITIETKGNDGLHGSSNSSLDGRDRVGSQP